MSNVRQSRGFTMIEALIVIAITGVLAAVVASFISRPAQVYADTTRRATLADAADVAIRRVAREVRLALPGSLRVTTIANTSYLEFVPTVTGGRYRDIGDGSTAGNFLDFSDSTKLTFDVIGPMVAPVASGDYVVVYNLGEGYAPADVYQGGNRATVNTAGAASITLDANVFAAQSPPLPSPNSRFQIVQGGVKAVTYACPTTTAGDIVRYWNYGFNAAQLVPAGGSSAIAARNVTCNFSYLPSVQRTGLLSMELTVSDAGSGERVTVFQQVHVDNVP